MRVFVKIKRGKKGYTIFNTAMVKIATVDRLNLINAYKTHRKGKPILSGEYYPYSENVDAPYKLAEVDNLAHDIVVMTSYEVYCKPTGKILEATK